MGSIGLIVGMLMLSVRTIVCQGTVPLQSFVGISGSQLVIDGSPFLFNGFNSYWMMYLSSDVNDRQKVSAALRDASAAGLSVCRTWAFADGGDRALQISPGTYDEHVFQGLDFIISEAKKYGIRLILSFVNNYKDYGGRPQYAQWAKNAGATISGDDDFYTNQIIKDYYKNHIKTVMTRLNTITRVAYKDEPTIMAWELINEPRCETDHSGKTVNGWVEEMASFVKSIDNKHLLEIGMEGFYGDSVPERKQANPNNIQVGTDFISNHLVKDIDFATIHAYPDIWLSGKSEDEQVRFMQSWLFNHWQDARNTLKKPLVLAEFGKSSKDPGYTLNKRDTYIGNVYRDVYRYAQNGGTMSGSLVWQVMAEGMESYGDGYEIVLSQSTSTAGIMSRQAHALGALAANGTHGPSHGFKPAHRRGTP
ncbi:mannan endo-1,4-beta-mannosidase 5-like [Salvia hispanica]|uniref:mannan endo-1,4-beta-mannosidase 5-like n=1 Tax=Salvia hispanica TaxID=49212 RepID=UPI0020099278|nr:mannan endo-1,4-beta-mannosidase 5-like [Salvia hispanica]